MLLNMQVWLFSFLVIFFNFFNMFSWRNVAIFNDICVCEAISIMTNLSHSHMTATGPQQQAVIS